MDPDILFGKLPIVDLDGAAVMSIFIAGSAVILKKIIGYLVIRCADEYTHRPPVWLNGNIIVMNVVICDQGMLAIRLNPNWCLGHFAVLYNIVICTYGNKNCSERANIFTCRTLWAIVETQTIYHHVAAIDPDSIAIEF